MTDAAYLQLASDLRANARRWREDGSDFYAILTEHIADDVERQGISWEILQDHARYAKKEYPGARLLAGVHRLVLTGQAPELTPHYPTTGGDGDAEAVWSYLPDILARNRDQLHGAVDRVPQTNEVARSDALIGGFLVVSQLVDLPLRLLEIGSSAGLNLHVDAYWYEQDGIGVGDPDSEVRFVDIWEGGRPPFEAGYQITSRRGCDLFPIDPATDEGRYTLLSYIWPDEMERFNRLQASLDIARKTPVTVDAASVTDWLEEHLLPLPEGQATVVFHSFVWPYLDADIQEHIEQIMAYAGEQASQTAPLAWVSFEPPGRDYQHLEVRVRLWPAGEDHILARSGMHGGPVEWVSA